jgi:hypothetical protein
VTVLKYITQLLLDASDRVRYVYNCVLVRLVFHESVFMRVFHESVLTRIFW